MVRAHPDFVVQFDEEVFALEAQLADLGPAERVDFGVSLRAGKKKKPRISIKPRCGFGFQNRTTDLKDQDPRVRDGQVDPHALPVVSAVRPDAVHVQLPRHLQQLNVGLSRGRASAGDACFYQPSHFYRSKRFVNQRVAPP